MKLYEVLAVAVNGEFVCWDCMNDEEKAVANDKMDSDDIKPVFADGMVQDDTCGRCGESLLT